VRLAPDQAVPEMRQELVVSIFEAGSPLPTPRSGKASLRALTGIGCRTLAGALANSHGQASAVTQISGQVFGGRDRAQNFAFLDQITRATPPVVRHTVPIIREAKALFQFRQQQFRCI